MDAGKLLISLLDFLQQLTRPDRSVLHGGKYAPPPTIEELFGAPPLTQDDSTPCLKDTVTENDDDVTTESDNVEEEEEVEENCNGGSHPPLIPLHETARQFCRRKTFTETDLQSIFTILRKLIDSALSEDCAAIACLGSELDQITILIRPLALIDMRIAAYMISLFSNLAVMKESKGQLNVPLIWDFVMVTAQTYIQEEQIFHLTLVVMSNLVHLKRLKLTRTDCKIIIQFIYPIYTKALLVETWATMLCNITAHHPEIQEIFIELKVVEILQRLVLYFGEEGKTAIRGIQCLANLATSFTNGHIPTVIE